MFILFSAVTYSQVAINSDGSPPHPSAMLDVKSFNKGMLTPRTSTTSRNAIPPVKGLLVYDTTLNSFYYHNGTSWNQLSAGGNNVWTQNGTNIYNNNTGNVGIGTTSPGYDLHIYKSNPSVGFYDVDDNFFSGYIQGDSSDLVINAYRKAYGTSASSGNLILQVGGSNGGPYSPLYYAGNVGIGAAEPTAKLHVNGNMLIGSGTPATGYSLSVNGKVIAEEVRVELDNSWPDYVFENNYELRSLPQVEKYIQKFGHLPGIPSATVVQKEGIALGDMNRRLLEKIEELTLYLIEQNKVLSELKQKVQTLETKQR